MRPATDTTQGRPWEKRGMSAREYAYEGVVCLNCGLTVPRLLHGTHDAFYCMKRSSR